MHDWTNEQRPVARYLEQIHGLTPEDARGKPIDDKTERFRVWAAESIWAGFHHLKLGEPRIAFRCAMQAAEYLGRSGGLWWDPRLSDAFSNLKEDIADYLPSGH